MQEGGRVDMDVDADADSHSNKEHAAIRPATKDEQRRRWGKKVGGRGEPESIRRIAVLCWGF